MKLRPSVQKFAEAMELKLRKHDIDRGEDGWADDTPDALLDRVFDEWLECNHALRLGRLQKAHKEAVDIGNFAMMVFDVSRL